MCFIDSAFDLGREDANMGRRMEDNPFDRVKDPQRHEAWVAGWLSANRKRGGK